MSAAALMPRRLAELASGLDAEPATALAEATVFDLALDSRTVTPGALFLACAGRTTHGLTHAAEAVARGARAVFYERSADAPAVELPAGVIVAAVPDLGRKVGLIADRFFGEPSAALDVAGITGTNGKTTCAWLLAQALNLSGRPAAYSGTLGVGVPPDLAPAAHTTPDAVTLQRQLARLRDRGVRWICMEVSSHALDQGRVAGTRFAAAAFTNLTRDHLDYHGTMEAYGAAKARLLAWPGLGCRVINIDDPFGAQLAATPGSGELVVTTRRDAVLPAGARWLRARRVRVEPAGLALTVESIWGNAELALRLVGEFNVDNALCVLGLLLAWGTPPVEAAAILARCRAASGRMELFGGRGRVPLAIVDYAHTPDALANALRAARAHCRGQLRVVFGCGGDRDAGKRAVMGRLAAELADEVVVTDDNPRGEDPGQIIAAILGGVPEALRTHVLVEHDRERAIRLALQRSGGDDVVLVAGKGHEQYQVHGTTRREFRDQQVVASCLGGGGA